ncbi:MAG TPA: plasmid pRiA4b ORF-3 family protein [Candidatus Thermoplasmatota archaeon]|nr:plasmid pRiA4b ORF-3 family protein [Candidatus Thermoplasmatota archaeon]
MTINKDFIITKTKPTPLIKDFTAFVQYLKTHDISLTPTNEHFSRTDLFELNKRMTYPNTKNTRRSDQKFYPRLHFFYHLAIGGKLFKKIPGKNSRLTLQETKRLRLFYELTTVEQYFFLLETFWVDTDWEKLQCGYFGRAPFYGMENVLIAIGELKPGIKILLEKKENDILKRLFQDWEFFLVFFSYFGFWKVTRKIKDEPNFPKSYFIAESIIFLPVGVKIAPILGKTRKLKRWNLARRRQMFGEWNGLPGSLISGEELSEFTEYFFDGKQAEEKDKDSEKHEPFFLPFVSLFKKNQLTKTIPRKRIHCADGTYVFKISLGGDLWRRIKLSSDHTLHDLHRSIQRAFDFDSDHLYSFFMDNKAWSKNSFVSPSERCGGGVGPFADEGYIGKLGLNEGQSILYLFDYGDEWRFRVKLEQIQKEKSKPKNPHIIDLEGKPPSQYE